MKRFYWTVALLTGLSLATLCVNPQGRSEETTPLRNDQSTHPLAQQVQVIPPPITESVSTPHKSRDGRSILTSVGVQPNSEKCVNCHFEDQSPTQAHPGNHLNLHAPETFGCVLCHGGEAQATNKETAHSSTETFPFLNERQIEASCGKCHTEPAVPGAHLLSGGRFVLNRYGCATCHNLPIRIPVARYAPRLDTIGNKVTKEWLRQWLEDPTVYLPESKMPKIEMAENAREAIIEFLWSLRNDALLQPIAGKGDAENGKKIFVDNECQSCHTVQGVGDKIGPALDRVRRKVNRLWLMNYLRKPATFHPSTKMPDYGLATQEILDVTEYLLRDFSDGATVLDQSPDYLPNPTKASEGFKLYISKGCAQCHGITKYMKVNITEPLRGWDILEAVRRIQAHRGDQIEVPEIDMLESDVELMQVALLAMQQNDIYKALTYTLEEGTLGDTDRFLETFWQFPIPLQGESPDYYNETVTKLAPESCGTCHTKQWTDWKTTRHAMAMGPGIWDLGTTDRTGGGVCPELLAMPRTFI